MTVLNLIFMQIEKIVIKRNPLIAHQRQTREDKKNAENVAAQKLFKKLDGCIPPTENTYAVCLSVYLHRFKDENEWFYWKSLL